MCVCVFKCITENKTKVLRIFLAFVLFFPFSISHSKVMNIEIFSKISHELLEYGTNIRYDRLYCVLKNQPHMAYQSLYLSIFLSFQQFFPSYQLRFISATVFKFCIHNEDYQVYYCKQNQGAEIYFCLLFLFFLFSSPEPKAHW